MVIIIRNQQREERAAIESQYAASSKNVNQWMDSNERKVRQLQPVSKDLNTVQIQLQEVRVMIAKQ